MRLLCSSVNSSTDELVGECTVRRWIGRGAKTDCVPRYVCAPLLASSFILSFLPVMRCTAFLFHAFHHDVSALEPVMDWTLKLWARLNLSFFKLCVLGIAFKQQEALSQQWESWPKTPFFSLLHQLWHRFIELFTFFYNRNLELLWLHTHDVFCLKLLPPNAPFLPLNSFPHLTVNSRALSHPHPSPYNWVTAFRVFPLHCVLFLWCTYYTSRPLPVSVSVFCEYNLLVGRVYLTRIPST